MASLHWKKYTLQFKRPSGTSRGVLQQKESYFLIDNDSSFEYPAIGECSLIQGLSPDPMHSYEETLDLLCAHLNGTGVSQPDLQKYPSIAFGLEMLNQDRVANGTKQLFHNEFVEGKMGMQINGLVWMGEKSFMRAQIIEKIEEGFQCIKLKIGALDFEKELDLLAYIRKEFGQEIEIRVDANGAFAADEARAKLDRLSAFHIHSIEQPIKPGQWEMMAKLCESTPIPIALDEELIAILPKEGSTMLRQIKPQYIILKPSLIGGWKASDDWIEAANEVGCAWWATSALESNIGLNAIAQYTFQKRNAMPQGLGTGSLYTNNFESPLYLQGQIIYYDPDLRWDLSELLP